MSDLLELEEGGLRWKGRKDESATTAWESGAGEEGPSGGSSSQSRSCGGWPSFRTTVVIVLASLLWLAPSPLRGPGARGPSPRFAQPLDELSSIRQSYSEPPPPLPALTLSPPPSPTQPDCQVCSPSDDLCTKWGTQVLTRSRGYRGSLARFKPFFEKLARGEDVKIGVVGGSISSCMDSTKEECYTTKMIDGLRNMFGVGVEYVDGTQSGMGSSFFAWCWTAQLGVPVDLVLVDVVVNDFIAGTNAPFDTLLRSLLSHSSQPAVLLLSLFSPLSDFTMGAPHIESISQYYDVPVISQRDVVVHHRWLHPPTGNLSKVHPWFSPAIGANPAMPGVALWPGGHHPGPRGHELIADLIVAWFRYERCVFERDGGKEVEGRMELELPTSVPKWSPYAKMDEAEERPLPPATCYSSAPGGNHEFPIVYNKGWSPSFWKKKHYFVAHKPGDHIVFDVVVPITGSVMMMHWKSSVLKFGSALVWFDEEDDKAEMIRGRWNEFATTPAIISFRQDPEWIGKHRKMHVLVMDHTDTGSHEFRISTLIY